MKLFLLGLLVMACACLKTSRIIMDQGISAVEGGDATAIVSGCGNAPIVGYTYCRKTEGDETIKEKIIFHAPIQNKSCPKGYPCTTGKIFLPDGSVIGIEFKENSSTAQMTWEDILKRPKFEKFDRGFYLFTLETLYVDGQGNERMIFQEGEIRLRVIGKNYIPLHEVSNDKNFTYSWKSMGYNMKLTTGGRAYVGK
jgi:hypothetical protein